jgi:hypothetical protein
MSETCFLLPLSSSGCKMLDMSGMDGQCNQICLCKLYTISLISFGSGRDDVSYTNVGLSFFVLEMFKSCFNL